MGSLGTNRIAGPDFQMDAGASVKQNRLYLPMQEKDNLFPDQVFSIEKFCYTLQWQVFTLPRWE